MDRIDGHLTRRHFLRATALGGLSIAAWEAAATADPSGDSRVVEVAAFGAAGDGRTDDRRAIQNAIHAAVEAGPGARVVFEAGKTYRLAASGEGYGALMVEGARGLVLDGRGATLLAHPSNRMLVLYDSHDVVVRDFLLDYDPLPFTQAELTRIELPEGRVRFRIAEGYDKPVVGGEDRYRDFKSSDCVFLDGPTRRFSQAWLRLRGVEPAGAGEFEAVFHGGAGRVAEALGRHRPGDWIAVKMLHPAGTPRRTPEGRFTATGVANLNIAFCHGVTLQRITSYAAPNMTFNAHGSEGVLLRQCEARRKPGTDRLIAGNSDGCHLKSLTVMPRLLDCRFDALMDDSVHMKISSNVVAERDGRRVRLNHGDIAFNDVVVEPGQAMSFYGWQQRQHLAFAEVVEVRRTRYREVWVTLDRSVPELSAGDLLPERAGVVWRRRSNRLQFGFCMDLKLDRVECSDACWRRSTRGLGTGAVALP